MARLPPDPKLAERFRQLQSSVRHIDYRYDMFIGRVDASGNPVGSPIDGLPDNYVWVHTTPDVNSDTGVPSPRTIFSAKNLTTEYANGAAVVVAFNVHTGENEVIGIDPIRGTSQYGSAAAGLNSPRKSASTPTPTSARDIIVGGLYVHTGLTVRIGSTWLPNGDYWDDTLTETLVPTATASMKSLVLVGVDLADSTFSTELTTDRAPTIPLITSGALTTTGAGDVKTVMNANPGVWWVAAVELANGATSIDSAKIVDLRFWRFTMTATLDELSDVDTTGVSDGDVLTYDNGTSTWVASAPTGGGSMTVTDGVTTVNNVTSVTVVGGTVTDDGGGAVTVTFTGGTSFTHTYYGKNAIGASTANMTGGTVFLKKITLASAGFLASIGAYIDHASPANNVQSLGCWLMSDNAGTPNLVIAFGAYRTTTTFHIGTTARWVDMSMGVYLAAGDYWICVQRGTDPGSDLRLYYDASVGSDRTQVIGNTWTADQSQVATSASTNDYSIRASVLS